MNAKYSKYVNPQWVSRLNLLQMNVRYQRCYGAELFTEDGNVILDFSSGYCVHDTEHNHPAIIDAIKDELDRGGPAMLLSQIPDLGGPLAHRLCTPAGDGLQKLFFACSGREGMESAIEFARKSTGRTGLIYAEGVFHGLTCGALSIMGDSFWRDKFGPILADTASVRRLAGDRRRELHLGDVSGSVDAITGEGLCLAFRQSIPFSAAIRAGDLSRYEEEHARIDAALPELFANLLAAHVRRLNLTQFAAIAATLE